MKTIEIHEELELLELKAELGFLLAAKDEVMAEINIFGPEEDLLKKLQKIEEELEEIKKLI